MSAAPMKAAAPFSLSDVVPVAAETRCELPIRVPDADVDAVFCIPDDQAEFVPDLQELGEFVIPPSARLPARGDMVYLASTAAFGVQFVIYERLASGRMRLEIWLQYVGPSRSHRPAECRRLH